jgi:hypothetical protein
MSNVVLTVNFDVQQISQRLDWSFTSGENPVVPGTGANTGLLAFQNGDTFNLVVNGNSHSAVLESLMITQCHLFCRPILHSKHAHLGPAGSYPPPSPFNDTSAVIEFVGPGRAVPALGSARLMQWASQNPLQCNATGRWEVSLILTVQIALTPNAGSYDAHRVFSFDPECEVGTGLGEEDV